ncbi:ADP-ribosylation/Crystallin J1 [Hypoxylon sp. FL1284]|nr:ADP-ribosylation/Crystallin J1 [Hypoxylon sp. FL1284]
MASLPEDYLERVYAGVLGKFVGVYLGRPFEGWTHQRILAELGHIRYYVNEKLGLPLVVTDDDISGTFTFVRALEEHDASPGHIPSSASVGKTWLNNIIDRKTIFWWGGNGVSTEHTAFLNLSRGIEAPHSGSIQKNGKTIAEQIGAQIFIDGFAMTAPGNPALAAELAGAAGSVSHDGESVYAAKLWAAMEAEAFVESDTDRLIDTGLRFIPSDSLIATLIGQVRSWCKEDEGDWLKTRQRIEDKYGYDKFPGFCHVVPNHGIMIMALIYASHDFHEAMHIVNTCGWDTDCNSGNLACLIAIIHGLSAFENGPDWRGPVADQALISSADGGYSINNAARIAYNIVDMGRKLAGHEPLTPPKEGAQFHFSLPGSVQGFRLTPMPKHATGCPVKVEQAIDGSNNSPGLAIRIGGLEKAATDPIEVMTDTFAPPETGPDDGYNLVSSPLVYPGQNIKAELRADGENTGSALVRFVIKAYTYTDELETLIGNAVQLAPGNSSTLSDTIPTSLGGRPIQSIGLAITPTTSPQPLAGTLWLDNLRWTGVPALTLRAAAGRPGDSKVRHRHAFVSGADEFEASSGKYVVANDRGEGLVAYGTRAWVDYRAVFRRFSVCLGAPAGVAVRVRGLNRYYALRFIADDARGRRVALTKALDERRVDLASAPFEWRRDVLYDIVMEVRGSRIRARVSGEVELTAEDGQYTGGGIGSIATDGSVLVEDIEIGPLD